MLAKVDSSSSARMIQANSKEEKKTREWGKKKEQLRMYINREKRNPYDSSGKKKRNRRVPYGPACLLVVNDSWKCMCVCS